MRRRFRGHIAGVGTASGTRLVVGHWRDTPVGAFSDVMVERADGWRLLLAPSPAVATFVSQTYRFDEVRVEEVDVCPPGAGVRGTWRVRTPSLVMDVAVGRRRALGVLLRLVPERVATHPAWCAVVDPIARVVLRGVRTRGQARAGRREYYGATDVHAVTGVTARLDEVDLGGLRPVDPPCRFGFTSTPRRPGVTAVVTTVVG